MFTKFVQRISKLMEMWCSLVNELLEAKLTIARIKVQLLDLTGELIANDLSDNGVRYSANAKSSGIHR